MSLRQPSSRPVAPVSLDFEAPPPVRYVEREVFIFQCANGGIVHTYERNPIAVPACPQGCGTMQQVGHAAVDIPHGAARVSR